MRSDVIRRIEAHPLRVRVGSGVEQWTIAPRVLPPGWWTVQDESDATLIVRAIGTATDELHTRPRNPVRAGDGISAAMLTPIAVGVPVRVAPITPETLDDWSTAPVRLIERVRFDVWKAR